MQYSPILPPFTPHTRVRSISHNRTASNWRTRRDDRFPPLSKTGAAWKESHERDNPYMDTINVISPINTDQNKSFQSTTILRSVPIMRRHLDTFGGRSFSIPAKTKPVPFHTGRFIFDPNNKPIFFEELTQNQRLQAELAMVEKVRGLKRKRESVDYRWGWKKFDLFGIEVPRGERRNLHAEVQKLKELILPAMARDIYTGRGIRLPAHHHTKRPIKQPTPGEPPMPPPPTSNILFTRDGISNKPSPSPLYQSYSQNKQRTSITKTVKSRDKPVFKQIGPQVQSVNNFDLLVQSVPVPGITGSPALRQLADRSSEVSRLDDATYDPIPQPSPVTKLHEPVEQVELIQAEPVIYEDGAGRSSMHPSPFVSETPIERSRSMAAPSASPEIKGQFNPLVSVSFFSDSTNLLEEEEQFKEKFLELTKDMQGNITFEQVLTVCPNELTKSQSKFLRCLYNITAQNVAFGAAEFIAIATLAREIVNMSSSSKIMFEHLNFATLEESLIQYTELFSSVDRAGRGRIGVSALLQVLSTTLQRQLEPDNNLAIQIMETMQKEYISDVSRIEFLSFLPYFLYLEEMA